MLNCNHPIAQIRMYLKIILSSSNFGKKKAWLTNKITVRSLKTSSPALDIHPFRPKLILMMSTFKVCGPNHVV